MADETKRETPDYMAMTSGEMLRALGTDARKWAEAFQQAFPPDRPRPCPEALFGWFANAIETARDAARPEAPPAEESTHTDSPVPQQVLCGGRCTDAETAQRIRRDALAFACQITSSAMRTPSDEVLTAAKGFEAFMLGAECSFLEVEAAKAQLGKLAQALAAAKAEIETLKQDRAHEARKLQIEAFEAETNRLRALQR